MRILSNEEYRKLVSKAKQSDNWYKSYKTATQQRDLDAKEIREKAHKLYDLWKYNELKDKNTKIDTLSKNIVSLKEKINILSLNTK